MEECTIYMSQEVRADDVLAAVERERRATLLGHLAEEGDRHHSVDERSTTLAGGSAGRTSAEVAVTLHHSDLPKLDDLGLVEYDPDSRTVRRTFDDDVEASLPFVGERLD